MRVVIVDDSSVMRRAIESYLGDEVEVVGSAGNGIQALEMIASTNPDAVTLDITMPEMDGLDCLEEIKAKHPNVKVMMITAVTDPAQRLKALKLGAKSFLNKPFTPATLREAFAKLGE